MAEKFKLTLAQLNATVGALETNAARARAAWEDARAAGADLVMLPEMFLTGYQLGDLVVKPAFLADVAAHRDRLVAELAALDPEGPALAIGLPLADPAGGKPFNAYEVWQNGRLLHCARKHMLPNDDVFDEVRYFQSGPISGPYRLKGLTIGHPLCEDAWHPDVPETLAETGADILLIPNGSPYRRDKLDLRMNVIVSRVVETGLAAVYLNAIGGQDDQLFDGASFALNPHGEKVVQLPPFEESVAHLEIARGPEGWRVLPGPMAPQPDAWEQDYHAMVLGLRDYMGKTGFSRVLLGLSGGIDSALVATIAADALGPENVRGVMLPSEYTSQSSLDDAADLAARLGIRLDTVRIDGARDAVGAALSDLMAGTDPDVTEENIQSRLRGLMLMAISNKHGGMLLTTGNKSEVSVGYATIYGDMAGGYNPIKDLYKTRVFDTCRWRNAHHRDWMMGPGGAVIPVSIIDKPPSAELRPDQKDEDSLPPYPVLDAILERLIEGDQSVDQIVAAGYERATVKRVEHLLYISEWKRFQSAPGPRLSTRAFWLDRRYPIVNRWRDPS